MPELFIGFTMSGYPITFVPLMQCFMAIQISSRKSSASSIALEFCRLGNVKEYRNQTLNSRT
jgi:hypothetical protein